MNFLACLGNQLAELLDQFIKLLGFKGNLLLLCGCYDLFNKDGCFNHLNGFGLLGGSTCYGDLTAKQFDDASEDLSLFFLLSSGDNSLLLLEVSVVGSLLFGDGSLEDTCFSLGDSEHGSDCLHCVSFYSLFLTSF